MRRFQNPQSYWSLQGTNPQFAIEEVAAAEPKRPMLSKERQSMGFISEGGLA
jgi:hypothetical protein